MRGWIMILVLAGGLIALCWYGVTGDTGPMGWLNSWQNTNTGSYSRGLSFGLLCLAGGLIGALALGLRALVTRRSGVGGGAAPTSFTAPADAKIAAMAVAMNDRTQWRWRMYLKAWLVGLALVWAVVLGWQGWDFHRRSADFGSDYTPLRLERTATAAPGNGGSHWAVQGRLLWNRSATQTTKGRYSETQTVYVPLVANDWQPGDAIQFVVRLPKEQVWALQQRTQKLDEPWLVRVDGSIPTPSRAVFERLEAPPADAAVMVEVVHSSDGRVSDTRPVFDWANTGLIGSAISATWTAGVWLGAFAVLMKVWQLRRRQRQQALKA